LGEGSDGVASRHTFFQVFLKSEIETATTADSAAAADAAHG
jgi:hypothetical protein